MKKLFLYSLVLLACSLTMPSCTTARLAQVQGKGVELDSRRFADLGIVPKGVMSNGDGYTIDITTFLEEETDGKLSDDEENLEDGSTVNIEDLLNQMGIPEYDPDAEGKPDKGGKTDKPAKAETTQSVKISCDNVWLIKLKECADSWLGTPYLFGGTTRKGIDCSAFTGTLYKNVFDVQLQRNSRAIYSKDCYQTVKGSDLQLGDLLFFVTNGKSMKSGNISHVGVYVGEGIFVHSCSSKGVAYSRLSDKYYVKTFLIGGRVLKFT